MADYFTLTYDIAAVLGVDPAGLEVIHAFVTSQYSGIADTDTNQVKPGTWPLDIDAETTAGTVDLPSSTDGAFNPSGPLYRVEVKYFDRPSGKTFTWRSGPPSEFFAMDADRNLADVVAEPVVFVTEALRDEVQATALAIANLEATNDGIMTAVAADPESSFAQQQLATIAQATLNGGTP